MFNQQNKLTGKFSEAFNQRRYETSNNNSDIAKPNAKPLIFSAASRDKILVSSNQHGNPALKYLKCPYEFVEKTSMTADYYIPPSAPRSWTYTKPSAKRAQAVANALNKTNSITGQNLQAKPIEDNNASPDGNNNSSNGSGFMGEAFAATTATNVIFLSLELHKARPNHLEVRMNRFPYSQPAGALYDNCGAHRVNQLRIVLVVVDVERYEDLLNDILLQTLERDFTMLCAWSGEEAMWYIEFLQRMQIFSLDPLYKTYDTFVGVANVGVDPNSRQAAKLKDQTDGYLFTGDDAEKPEKEGAETNADTVTVSDTNNEEDSQDLGILAGWGDVGSSTTSKRKVSEPIPSSETTQLTENRSESIDEIEIISEKQVSVDSSNTSKSARASFYSLPHHDRQNMINSLSQLTHVTKKDAEQVLKHYGSIAAAVLDGGRNLSGLPGWGKRKVDEFQKAFFEPFIEIDANNEGLDEYDVND